MVGFNVGRSSPGGMRNQTNMIRLENNPMNTIKVRREELLDALRKNREAHREVFLRSLEGFKKKAIEILEEKLATARKGIRDSVFVNLQRPTDQTREYDRWIRAMEMETRDEIELTMQDFGTYIMDEWNWKAQFTATTSQYI